MVLYVMQKHIEYKIVAKFRILVASLDFVSSRKHEFPNAEEKISHRHQGPLRGSPVFALWHFEPATFNPFELT